VFALSNGGRAMDPAGAGPKAVEARAGLTSVSFISGLLWAAVP
jgi:hypothetical protein